MNTLAVIEAADRVGKHQVSTAMTAIALCYTLGGVLGPSATGVGATYISDQALMLCIAAVGAVFAAMLVFRKTK